jgi:hypothetical protein
MVRDIQIRVARDGQVSRGGGAAVTEEREPAGRAVEALSGERKRGRCCEKTETVTAVSTRHSLPVIPIGPLQ